MLVIKGSCNHSYTLNSICYWVYASTLAIHCLVFPNCLTTMDSELWKLLLINRSGVKASFWKLIISMLALIFPQFRHYQYTISKVIVKQSSINLVLFSELEFYRLRRVLIQTNLRTRDLFGQVLKRLWT